ncbi:unnamed protein product [Calypogeia fissa]
MRGHERSYDISELVDYATSLNRLAALETTNGLVGIGKTHKKHSNIWMKIHKEQSAEQIVADQSDYTGIESNEEIVQALKEGFQLAQDVCIQLQMNPSSSCKDQKWWKTPWLIEARGVKVGGFCDVNMEALAAKDIDACLDDDDVEEENTDADEQNHISIESGSGDEDESMHGDLEIASANVQDTMSHMYNHLLYRDEGRKPCDPTVIYQGVKMYKSTVVNQCNNTPGLSKDRLTRVKEGLYFNNLVDKPKLRADCPTMFIQVGTDCGVYFVEDIPPVPKTRRVVAIAEQLKGKGKGKKGPLAKKPRGNPAAVDSCNTRGVKYSFYIGRVQSIQRKYGSKVGRSRECIDLLDRPSDEAGCKIKFNWFIAQGESGMKYKYDQCDPQLIDLDCEISTIWLVVNVDNPHIFHLDKEDLLSCRSS